MTIKNNILETIGNTPLVKINKITAQLPCLVLGKIETFNPGHSIKDRMAVKMLDDAERLGRITEGGTIIECTSGNTGMGLAIAAAVRGYRCIFTTSDKPIPVFPDVHSIIVPPSVMRPKRSASSSIFTAIRSLIECPGLKVSILPRTKHGNCAVILLILTIGVLPIVSRILFFIVIIVDL